MNVYLTKTSTPAGEVKLLSLAASGDPAGLAWLDMVKKGSGGDKKFEELALRPLGRVLQKMAKGVLIPSSDNFTPESRTPWGGTKIASEFKAMTVSDLGLVVGESWEISGHKSFPNRFELSYAGTKLNVPINILETLFPESLYGKKTVRMPFLLKLVNSGSWQPFIEELKKLRRDDLKDISNLNYHEIHLRLAGLSHNNAISEIHRRMLQKNLSVQVHPTSEHAEKIKGAASKTESWIILEAEKGAGIYLGLKEDVTKDEFGSALKRGEDVTKFLNFVEVKKRDVFFIPAGTIHAIGSGIFLAEPQETSETTYRVYDYGRTDDKGKPRELHVKEAMAVVNWDGERGSAAVELYRRSPKLIENGDAGTPQIESLVESKFFETRRISFKRGDEYKSEKKFKGFTVFEGEVQIWRDGEKGPLAQVSKGRSFIIPAAFGIFKIKGIASSVVLETF